MEHPVKRVLLTVVVALILLVPWVPASIDREGYWRDPALINLLAPPVEGAYRASIIKSIQTGTVTINTGATTGNATLTTAVSSTSTIIVPGGTVTANSSGNTNVGPAMFTLTTTTNVQMACADDGVSSPTCSGAFTAVEFYPNVLTSLGIQRGTITIAAASTSNTATISTVGSKAGLFPCGARTSATARSAYTLVRQVLTNTTTVTASRQDQDAATTATGCWQVADFRG